MALVDKFCIIYTNECTVFHLEDQTNWGSPEIDRNAGAHVLLAIHVKEDRTEEFLTIDSAPYTSKLDYVINNTVDGYYLFEILRFPIYDINANYIKEIKDSNGVITTYASLIYYPATNKFYKAIEPSLNIAPDAVNGATYWQEITNFTLNEIRSSNAITIYEHKDVFLCRSRKCVKDLLIGLGCGCDDMKKLEAYYRRKSMLDGAQALADNLQYLKAETTIRYLESLCPTCS